MKTMMFSAAVLMLIGAGPASAFPPTATISPGYDRALAESRRAREAAPPVVAEPAPVKKLRKKP